MPSNIGDSRSSRGTVIVTEGTVKVKEGTVIGNRGEIVTEGTVPKGTASTLHQPLCTECHYVQSGPPIITQLKITDVVAMNASS